MLVAISTQVINFVDAGALTALVGMANLNELVMHKAMKKIKLEPVRKEAVGAKCKSRPLRSRLFSS